MWPFSSKTLKDRYSKLVKLIMSIDSHFQITEDEEDSLRLHLPNYKGNQTMDFHIYLMEPQLHISFVTEIEGEKISVLSYFDQYADQQDMFNAAMARNLERIHNVLGKKFDESAGDEEEQAEEIAVPDSNEEEKGDEGYGLNHFFDFNESYKKHILTIMALRPGSEFYYYKPQTSNPLWKYNGQLLDYQNLGQIGCSIFAWIMKHYEEKEDFCYLLDFLGVDCMGKKYLDLFGATLFKKPEELIIDIKRNIPSFKLGNDPQKVQTIVHQTWMDLIAINNFIDYCSNSLDNLKNKNQSTKKLRDCSSIEDLAFLFLSEFEVEKDCHSEKTEEETSLHNSIEEATIVNSWSLLDFARAHGQMKLLPPSKHIDALTGEEFIAPSCAFVHPTKRDEQGRQKIIFVGISLGLREMTPNEIAAQKEDLVINELVSGNYVLARKTIGKTGYNHISNCLTKDTCKHIKLTIEQRYALYFFADMFGGGLYNKKFSDEEAKKETLDILRDYQEDLNLTELEVKYISSTDFNLKLAQLFEILRGIKNESDIDNLLITCGILINLNRASNSYKDFYRMTQEMGYSEEETKNKMIQLGFKKDSPIIYNLNSDHMGGSNNKKNIETNGKIFNFDSSFRKHALSLMVFHPQMDFWYYSHKEDEKPIWLYDHKEGLFLSEDEYVIIAAPLMWIITKHEQKENLCYLLDLLDEQIAGRWAESEKEPEDLMTEIKRYIPSFKLGSDPQKVKTSLQWLWIDLQAILYFIGYCTKNSYSAFHSAKLASSLQECTSLDELVRLYLFDFNVSGKGHEVSTDVTDEDLKNSWTDEYGVIYSADKKRLLKASYLNKYIVNHWPLITFAKLHGKPQLATFKKGTPDEFKGLAFTNPNDPNNVCFVSFSSKLGEKTAAEIVAMKNDLEVIQLKVDEEIMNRRAGEGRQRESYCLCKKGALITYQVIEGTITICDNAFENFSYLEKIEIPTTTTDIGENAFSYCKDLTYITFNGDVNSIGKSAFEGCIKLSSIIIPKGLKSKFEMLLPANLHGKIVEYGE